MKKIKEKEAQGKGSILVTVVILTAVISFACIGVARLGQYHHRKQYGRTNWVEAYYTAENAMLEGIQMISDELHDPSNTIGTYILSDSEQTLQMPYSPGSEVNYCTMTIEPDPMGMQDNFQVTASAVIGGKWDNQQEKWAGSKIRTIRSLVRWRPPSLVFDYEYFLNNWGWWWGSSIRGYGDQRSNWDFDFRYNPYVFGHIFANGEVESNQSPVDPFAGSPPFRGTAGGDPLTYCHVGSPRINMPNLKDLTYYETNATGSIEKGGELLVDGIHGDNETKPGIYLKGTDADPLEINGTVVIRGDCILRGTITGQGTVYVGGNLYIAGNVEYDNGPSFNPPPESMSGDDRDTWVDNSMDKDLISFAVREAILGGKVNSSDWKSCSYETYPYGLKHVGDESQLGPDGIANTPDDGVKYMDTNGDGVPDSAWYDADEDGVVDDNYDYNTDLKMTDARRSQIQGYPKDDDNNLLDYNQVASDQLTLFEGIYYTNHAWASRSRLGPDYLQGTIICRDEAWIFSNSLYIRYDSRIHSRYQRKYFGGDPNRIIDLGLPISEDVRILDRYEMKPQL